MASSLSSIDRIGDFAEYEKTLDISHSGLFKKAAVDSDGIKLIINSTSIVDRYYYYILKECFTYTLTEKEYMRYRYRPKLFCLNAYGTTELWSLLLKVNNWVSVSEFNSRTVKMFKESILDVLNEILVLEHDNIVKNKLKVEK